MVSFITDADDSAGAVAVAAAQPRTGLADVDVVDSPALPLAAALLLEPAELRGPAAEHTKYSTTATEMPFFDREAMN